MSSSRNSKIANSEGRASGWVDWALGVGGMFPSGDEG
jgi:hypothetical protein